ncbi:hypothetical protein ACQ4M3_02790 [Leptolyngbya sp. AN03gr2]|uniref:hypothetical protein n=1 Tax=unclassified Leptolyngbya TaxID=2650499 RepID=UPI003D32198F
MLSLNLSACQEVVSSLSEDSQRKRSSQEQPDSDDSITVLRWAIIGQESGRNFRAINPHSGALGYAQVMPNNLPKWSREALGYVLSRDQFLSRPDLQIAIIDHKLNQYWQRSIIAAAGDEAIAVRRVAAWWYSGNPNLYRSTHTQFYNGYRYPSIAEYCWRVLQKYQGLVSQTATKGLGT